MLELDDFVRQYLATALWSTNDESTPEGGEPMDANYDIGDFTDEAVEAAIADCDAFRAKAGNLLDDLDETRAAHCFWLERNGHGAGFFDEYSLPKEQRKALSAICDTFPEINPYIGDDSRIYF